MSTVVAGVAVAAAFSMPHGETDDPSAFLSYGRHSHGIAIAVGLASMVAAFAFVPAMVGVGRYLRARGSRVGALGALLMVAGFAAMQGHEAVDAGLVELAARPATTVPQLHAAIDSATGSIVYDTQFALFLVGHVIGLILLGIGVIRTRYLPLAVGALLPLGAVGHFVADAVGNTPLDVASFWVFAAALVALGARILRTSDAQWDAP